MTVSRKRFILLVEDDVVLRDALAELIKQHDEFALLQAGSVAEAWSHLATSSGRVDLVLLDLGLPDGDGRVLCADLRRDGHMMPVLMLTGADSETDIVLGLEVGAVGYLCKPVRGAELIARIRAALRDFDASEQASYSVGPFGFYPATKTLVREGTGKKVALTSKEVSLLRYLIGKGDEGATRQVLLNEIWGYNASVDTHTLETHVYRLRQKIEADTRKPVLLLTTSDGYCLARDGATLGTAHTGAATLA